MKILKGQKYAYIYSLNTKIRLKMLAKVVDKLGMQRSFRSFQRDLTSFPVLFGGDVKSGDSLFFNTPPPLFPRQIDSTPNVNG